MSAKFASKSDGLNAHVCMDIPPIGQRKKSKVHIPKLTKHHTAYLKIPDEYALALLEMYPGKKSLSSAIYHHIKLTVKLIDENSLT